MKLRKLFGGVVTATLLTAGIAGGAPLLASAMTVDDARKYAVETATEYVGEKGKSNTGSMLNTDEKAKAYPLAAGENGWGWDPATATLTFRNYDDRARLNSADPEVKYLPGFQVNNDGKKPLVTIKFEGVNYLSANAGGSGIRGIDFSLSGQAAQFVGAPGAVLNIDTYPVYNTAGEARLDQWGILCEDEACSRITFKSGTVNITGHYTKADIDKAEFYDKKKTKRSVPVFFGIDTLDIGASKVEVAGSANLNIKVDTDNPKVGFARPITANTIKVTTSGNVYLEGYGKGSMNIGMDADDNPVTLTGIFNGAGKVAYKWTNNATKEKKLSAFTTNSAQANIDAKEYVGYLTPAVGSTSAEGYLQGNDGKIMLVPVGESVVAEIGRIYAVSTALVANDSGVTGNPSAQYFDGTNTFPLQMPFGAPDAAILEVQAIGSGHSVQLTAPAAPEGYVLNWSAKKDGVDIPKADLAAFYAELGISASDLGKASFTYKQPAANLQWTVEYKKPEKPVNQATPAQPAKNLPRTGSEFPVFAGGIAALLALFAGVGALKAARRPVA